MMYMMTPEQHAQIVEAMTLAYPNDRSRLPSYVATLAMVKAMQPVEPTAFICHGYPYLHPSQDDYCGNVEDHIHLYTPTKD